MMMITILTLLLACVALSSGCGDQAAVMQRCLANTPEFAARLGSALQACGQVSYQLCVEIILVVMIAFIKGVRR